MHREFDFLHRAICSRAIPEVRRVGCLTLPIRLNKVVEGAPRGVAAACQSCCVLWHVAGDELALGDELI